jgi:hypothetical protein
MKYRIKIDYYDSRKETYTPQVKGLLFWSDLDITGEILWKDLSGGFYHKDLALGAINKHDLKYGKPKSSKIEYITK